MIISTLIATIASAYLYRWGGMGSKEFTKKFPNLPLFLHEKLTRRLGCMLVACLWLWLNLSRLNIVAFILSAGLMFGALTSYNDWLNNGKEDWKCWLMTGACYSLALLPLAITGGISWLGLSLRTIILSLTVMTVSELSGNADVEEYGRGGLFLATMPIILIGG